MSYFYPFNLFDTRIQEFRLTHINYKMGLERFIDSRLRYENKKEFNILSRDAIFSPFFVDPEKKIFNINLSLIHVFKLFERIPMPLVGTQIRKVYLRMWLSHEMLHFKLSHWVYESLQEIQVELLKFYYIEILERESIVSRFPNPYAILKNPSFTKYYQKEKNEVIESNLNYLEKIKPLKFLEFQILKRGTNREIK